MGYGWMKRMDRPVPGAFQKVVNEMEVIQQQINKWKCGSAQAMRSEPQNKGGTIAYLFEWFYMLFYTTKVYLGDVQYLAMSATHVRSMLSFLGASEVCHR